MALREVTVTEEVWLSCIAHALSTEQEEIMGILLGDVDESGGTDGRHVAHIWWALPQLRADRRKDRVETTPEQLAEAAKQAEQLGQTLNVTTRVIGWYHSHPHITVHPSHVDVRTQAMYQNMDQGFVGLIFACFDNDTPSQTGRVQAVAFQSVPPNHPKASNAFQESSSALPPSTSHPGEGSNPGHTAFVPSSFASLSRDDASLSRDDSFGLREAMRLSKLDTTSGDFVAKEIPIRVVVSPSFRPLYPHSPSHLSSSVRTGGTPPMAGSSPLRSSRLFSSPSSLDRSSSRSPRSLPGVISPFLRSGSPSPLDPLVALPQILFQEEQGAFHRELAPFAAPPSQLGALPPSANQGSADSAVPSSSALSYLHHSGEYQASLCQLLDKILLPLLSLLSDELRRKRERGGSQLESGMFDSNKGRGNGKGKGGSGGMRGGGGEGGRGGNDERCFQERGSPQDAKEGNGGMGGGCADASPTSYHRHRAQGEDSVAATESLHDDGKLPKSHDRFGWLMGDLSSGSVVVGEYVEPPKEDRRRNLQHPLPALDDPGTSIEGTDVLVHTRTPRRLSGQEDSVFPTEDSSGHEDTEKRSPFLAGGAQGSPSLDNGQKSSGGKLAHTTHSPSGYIPVLHSELGYAQGTPPDSSPSSGSTFPASMTSPSPVFGPMGSHALGTLTAPMGHPMSTLVGPNHVLVTPTAPTGHPMSTPVDPSLALGTPRAPTGHPVGKPVGRHSPALSPPSIVELSQGHGQMNRGGEVAINWQSHEHPDSDVPAVSWAAMDHDQPQHGLQEAAENLPPPAAHPPTPSIWEQSSHTLGTPHHFEGMDVESQEGVNQSEADDDAAIALALAEEEMASVYSEIPLPVIRKERRAGGGAGGGVFSLKGAADPSTWLKKKGSPVSVVQQGPTAGVPQEPGASSWLRKNIPKGQLPNSKGGGLLPVGSALGDPLAVHPGPAAGVPQEPEAPSWLTKKTPRGSGAMSGPGDPLAVHPASTSGASRVVTGGGGRRGLLGLPGRILEGKKG